MKKIFLTILCLIISVTTSYAGWYDSSWAYRKLVTVTSPSSGYVKSGLTIYYTGTHSSAGEVSCEGECETNFSDVVITGSDGETLQNYDIVSKTDSDNMVIATKAGSNLYVYFGNANTNVAHLSTTIPNAMGYMWFPGGTYDADNKRINLAWQNEAWDPKLTYFSTETGQWADQYWGPFESPGIDVHFAPAIKYFGKQLHVMYGAHNSPILYRRSEPEYTYKEVDDLTDFTAVNVGTVIDVESDNITVTDLTRNASRYVYDDKGVDHYDGDFEIEFTINVSATDSSCLAMVSGVSNSINDYRGLYLNIATTDLLSADIYQKHFRVVEHAGGSFYCTNASNDFSFDTQYWCTFERDESVGTYGTAYLKIYTNEAKTALFESISLTLHEKNDFRYYYAINSWPDGHTFDCSFVWGQDIETSYPTMEDCTWETMANPGWETMVSPGAGSYPKLMSIDDTTLYCFYRDTEGFLLNGEVMLKSTDNGDSWTALHILDNIDYSYYVLPCIAPNNDIFMLFDFHDFYDYYNLYALMYDASADQWQTMGGLVLDTILPLSKASLDNYCKIKTSTAHGYRAWPKVVVDGDNNPAFVYNYPDSGGTTGACGFMRWSGSAWINEHEFFTVDGFSSYFITCDGSGATATYDVYMTGALKQDTRVTDYTNAGHHYKSTDGGANWTQQSDWYDTDNVDVYSITEITGGGDDDPMFMYTSTPKTGYPSSVRVYPEPDNTIYRLNQGNIYTFQDKFERSEVSAYDGRTGSIDPLYSWYGEYPVTEDDRKRPAISDDTLKIISTATGLYKRIVTLMNFDTDGWTGYHLYFEIPDFDSTNGYTDITFGTVADRDEWDTTASNIPEDGLLLRVHTSGTLCDVSAWVAGIEVIDDDDNAITTKDFDIYVLKSASGDQITVKNNSDATTVYSGTIPSSGQLDDVVNIFMGVVANGGTSADAYFDNVLFSEWNSTEPAWSTAGAIEEDASFIPHAMWW